MIARFVTMALAVSLLGACAAGPMGITPPPERLGQASDLIEGYRLGVGDKLRVTVYNEAALSGEVAVGANGMIAISLIGEVPSVGKTPPEVAAEIQKKLADGYLRDPKVSVEVTTYRPYYILGEVKAPGPYPYVSGLTVVNAVASAQGYTPRANQRIVFVRSSGAAQEVAYRLTPDLRVLPGDTVRLGERYF